MRSATIFWVFGGIIVLLFAYSALSSFFESNDPVRRTATQFLTAVQKRDMAALNQLVETPRVKIIQAGNSLSGLRFPDTEAFQGVFSKKDAILWTNGEILQMTPKPGVAPTIAEKFGIATVPMTNGCKLYLRRQQAGGWKVFYIAKPEAPKQ
ncbi:MAG: hypothetical protein ACYC7E_03600 [Armatimonadota bacterium]